MRIEGPEYVMIDCTVLYVLCFGRGGGGLLFGGLGGGGGI